MSNIKIRRGVFSTTLELIHADVAAGFPIMTDDYSHVPLDFNRDFIKHEELTKEGSNLIDTATPKPLFIYRFSGIGESYPPTAKMKWRGQNVLLGHIIRCLLSDQKYSPENMGIASDFFESKSGKPINLATAKHESVHDFEQQKNSLNANFVEAVELLRRCGFVNVEFTSKRR